MKKLFLATLTVLLMMNCSTSDSYEDNPYIPDYKFDTGTLINTSLPKYNALNFPGNYIILDSYGVNGVVLYYVGSSMYTAFELTDPNHVVTSCSVLEVDGILATCGCDDDDNSYNIVNGYPSTDTVGEYTLKPYFVKVSGSTIRVYNE